MISSTAKQKQHGTALTWVVSLFFIFMMVALVVDAGRVYHDKRKLQSLANKLATDLVEGAQTCGGVSGGIDVSAIATSRLKDLIDDGSTFKNVTVSYAELSLMKRDSDTGEFVVYALEDAEESNALSLQLEKPVGGLLYFVVDEPLVVETTVRKEVVAGLALDGKVLSLTTDQSEVLSLVLSDLLGAKGLELDVGGIQDLAGAVTDVDRLVADLGLSGLDEVPVSDILDGILDDQITRDLTASASSLLNQMIGLADTEPTITNVDVESVIAGVHDAKVPAGAEVNALGFVQSVILNAGDSLSNPVTITLPDDDGVIDELGLGGLLGIVASLDVELFLNPSPGYIIASAKRGENGEWPSATSKAVSAKINSTLLGGIGGELSIELNTASANVELYEVDCALGDDNVIDELAIRADVSVADLNVSLSALAGIGKVNIPGFNHGGSPESDLDPPFRDIHLAGYSDVDDKMERSLGGTDEALSELAEDLLGGTEVCLLFVCVPVSENGAVTGILANVVDPILSSLLVPLLDALGIDLAPSKLVLESIEQSYTLVEGGLPVNDP